MLVDDGTRIELLKMQITIYVDLYKSHFDFFIKGVIVYLAMVGAIAGYIFRSDITASTRYSLGALASLLSLIAFFATQTSIDWQKDTEKRIAVVSNELGIDPISFTHSKRALMIVEAMCVFLFISGLLIIFLVKPLGR